MIKKEINLNEKKAELRIFVENFVKDFEESGVFLDKIEVDLFHHLHSNHLLDQTIIGNMNIEIRM